jgi:hypothetical protein
MRHMIRECVGDTPWSRGNVYMRTDIWHECVGDRRLTRGTAYMRYNIYGTSVLVTVMHDSPDTSRGRM